MEGEEFTAKGAKDAKALFWNLEQVRDPYDLEDYRSRGTANPVSVK
jgi:hypothetical protein